MISFTQIRKKNPFFTNAVWWTTFVKRRLQLAIGLHWPLSALVQQVIWAIDPRGHDELPDFNQCLTHFCSHGIGMLAMSVQWNTDPKSHMTVESRVR